MGVATGLLSLAGSAISAYGQYQEGKVAMMQAQAENIQAQTQNIQAETNAQIYEAQAANIEEAKKIVESQYRTKTDVLRGEAVTNAARGGLKISGTTANSISQSIMQLQMDSTLEKYNLNMEKQRALTNAADQRLKGKQYLFEGQQALYRGKLARSQANMGAFKTVLSAGKDYYDKYWGQTSSSGNNTLSWAKGQVSKIRSWGNTRLSGGLPTTNSQILQGSGSYIV